MNNISVLTDFEALTNTSNFRKLDTPEGLEGYSIYCGGNFVFISNTCNRTIRFSLGNLNSQTISADDIYGWVKRIHQLYPNF